MPDRRVQAGSRSAAGAAGGVVSAPWCCPPSCPRWCRFGVGRTRAGQARHPATVRDRCPGASPGRARPYLSAICRQLVRDRPSRNGLHREQSSRSNIASSQVRRHTVLLTCVNVVRRRTSRPVGRVLSPRITPRRATIHLRLPLPAASSGLPAGSGGPPSNACAAPPTRKPSRTAPLDLAPGGVCRATRVTSRAGGLLHRRFTLTAGRRNAGGGLLSVALSRGSPRVGVTHHLALWSPDLPRRASPDPNGSDDTRRGRPAGSSAVIPVYVAVRGADLTKGMSRSRPRRYRSCGRRPNGRSRRPAGKCPAATGRRAA